MASVRVRSTDYEGMFRKIEKNYKRKVLSDSAEKYTERVLAVEDERDVLLLMLKDYKMCKENTKRKLMEQDVILNTIAASMK